MKLLHAAVVAVLSLGLTGCVVSEKTFVQSRIVIKQRPDLRAKILAKCAADGRKVNRQTQEMVAAMVDLKVQTLPETFCRRMLQNYLSGRMTYQDYKDFVQHRPTARVIRLMRGH